MVKYPVPSAKIHSEVSYFSKKLANLQALLFLSYSGTE